MKPDEVKDLADRITRGELLPCRVLCSADGAAMSPPRAWREHGIWPALCLVRRDGWTLGAPVALAGVAWSLWDGQWAALVPVGARPTQPHHGN